jgi:hypothetical protein
VAITGPFRSPLAAASAQRLLDFFLEHFLDQFARLLPNVSF